VGDKITMEATLERVAELAAATDDWRFAARMWGTVKTVNKASGRLLAFGPTAALFLAAVSALDEHPELRAPFDAGCAITLDEAIPEALAWLESGNPRRRTADQ
jgi:hypothetical protein